MNRSSALSFAALLLMSSCGTYAGEGAATGGYFGAILGSAIGGISGGPRGSDVGTLAGVVGGAIIGAAVGSAADNAAQERRNYPAKDYGYENDRGSYGGGQTGYDDRIEFETDEADNYRGETNIIEICNVRFNDSDNDRKISAGEVCKVSFEIMNRSKHNVYNITPEVTELTGNRHIHISPGVLVENIAPHKGVRYTASVGAGRKIKDGYIKLQLSVKQRDNTIAATAITVGTSKR